MYVPAMTAAVLDKEVRAAKWHFMWLTGAYSHLGVGNTVELATRKAVERALGMISESFNVAEVDLLRVRKYPGFYTVKVTLHARHIQQSPSLGLADEIALRSPAA
jgi:hypothetical protein